MSSAFKKIPLTLLSVAVIGVTDLSFAQLSGENLLDNGSFETIDGKVPKKLDMIKSAKGWYSLTSFQADLFVAEKSELNSNLSGSINSYGKEQPKEGNNYAGISVYSPAPDPKKAKLPRNYIATNLSSPMKKGMRYCVKYYVSLADLSKYSTNNIGAYFTKDDKELLSFADAAIVQPKRTGKFIMDYRNESRTINTHFGWEQICGTYVAEGGEKFMVLGNFFSDKETKFEGHPKYLGSDKSDPTYALLKAAPQPVAAYYFIDDVSVTLLETGEECDCITASAETEYSAAIYHKKVIISDTMSAAEKIEAHEVHFAITRADLSENGREALNFIADVLQKNPKLTLLISGHSDPAEQAIATEKPDFEGMDDRRTVVVYNYLVEKGIDKSRLSTERLGVSEESKDADESDDPELHTIKDLRVTFTVHE
jgi:outer membrane protein OmpA-like peptidoglycan-associated protein